ADWEGIMKDYPAYASAYRYPRGLLYARRGELDQAAAELEAYRKGGGTPLKAFLLENYITAARGDIAAALTALEAEAIRRPGDAAYLYEAAQVAALIAELAARGQPAAAKDGVERAMTLLRRAAEAGLKITSDVRDRPELESVRRHPGFV